MTSCAQARGWIHPYIDGEISAGAQIAFEAHLLECERCRAEYERVREVVDTVRGSKPLYPARDSLTSKLRKIVEYDRSQRRRRMQRRVATMAASFAVTVLLFAVLPMIVSQRFTSFAADTHLQYARGVLPLAVLFR